MGMPIEVRDRWVAALRSGEYEQGQGQFELKGRYCCLGVLCDVLGQPTTLPHDDNYDLVQEFLGWEQLRELVHLNDTERSTFAEIADHVERKISVS